MWASFLFLGDHSGISSELGWGLDMRTLMDREPCMLIGSSGQALGWTSSVVPAMCAVTSGELAVST